MDEREALTNGQEAPKEGDHTWVYSFLWPWTRLSISLALSLLICKRLEASISFLGKAQTFIQIPILPFTRGVTSGKWPCLNLSFPICEMGPPHPLKGGHEDQHSSLAPSWSRVDVYANLVPSSLVSLEFLSLWSSMIPYLWVVLPESMTSGKPSPKALTYHRVLKLQKFFMLLRVQLQEFKWDINFTILPLKQFAV